MKVDCLDPKFQILCCPICTKAALPRAPFSTELRAMKTFLLVSALLAGIAGISTHADAQNHPWCGYLAVTGGATNCGFTTFEQCMGYISGMAR
jgi:hypothetical protein